jgi:hypothetical protein
MKMCAGHKMFHSSPTCVQNMFWSDEYFVSYAEDAHKTHVCLHKVPIIVIQF